MTASVRILTTRTVDSSPAILLVDPDGTKTLINCGEGCQRSFLEYQQKLSSVHRVCLTHLSHDAIAGLPGMILTSCDSAVAAQVTQVAGTKPTKPDTSTLSLAGLEIVGPTGTQQYIHSLRHFMRRIEFPLTIREGQHNQVPPRSKEELSSKKRANKKKRKRQENNDESNEKEEQQLSYFGVHTIPLAYQIPNPQNRPMHSRTAEVVSFVFTTPPVLGKFLPDKAKELGIPPGPLYAKLKAGEDITFTDNEGKEQTVQSDQVVLEPTPGVIVAVLYYPTLEVWKALQPPLDDVLKAQTQSSPKTTIEVELVLHLTSKEVLENPICKEWRNQLQTGESKPQHVFMETTDPAIWTPSPAHSPSPHTTACIGAMVRSKISSDVYRAPEYLQSATADSTESDQQEEAMLTATPLMDYVLVPRAKKGFKQLPMATLEERQSEGMELLNSSGALQQAQQILGDTTAAANGNKASQAELLFTGTGSAIPCKHRNVTGMCLRKDDGQGILLDIGEGTVGQLLRAASPTDSPAGLLRSIKAAWVSHPHADHHLGLLRLLTDRQAVLDQKGESDPLLVIGPPPILDFLHEYEKVDPRIASSFIPLDCRQLQNTPRRPRERLPRVMRENSLLAGTNIEAIQVTHCPYSYAVVLDGTSFGRVAYSGDCRPSQTFAERARGADILIHEATFEIGMEAEATMKRHSTVGEAYGVAQAMKAKRLVLTHFSQRYPKVPPLATGNDAASAPEVPVIFAFDYMGLTPTNLGVASKLTPALRCLYPEADGNADEKSDGAVAMSIPGFFAQNPYQ